MNLSSEDNVRQVYYRGLLERISEISVRIKIVFLKEESFVQYCFEYCLKLNLYIKQI